MSKKKILYVALILGCLFVSNLGTENSPAQGNTPGGQVADLEDQLKSGLKARLPNEFAFIAKVVQSVHDRRLSSGEVKSVFQWARRKNEKTPFPYFERAMRIVARKKGVSL